MKKSGDVATLIWNGQDPNILQLVDLPKLVQIKKGDTIETNSYSSIFPEGIPIGRILDFNLNTNDNYYDVNVALFNDMTNIKHVYIIENKDRNEIKTLESLNE